MISCRFVRIRINRISSCQQRQKSRKESFVKTLGRSFGRASAVGEEAGVVAAKETHRF